MTDEDVNVRPEAVRALVDSDAYAEAMRGLRDGYVKGMLAAEDEDVIRCRDRVRALDDLDRSLRRMAEPPSKPPTRI